MTPTTANSAPQASVASERLPGIDLLRVAAMFMVVLLHLLIWNESDGCPVPAGTYRAIARYLRAECVCAVDLFVLASGFLLATRRFRFSRIVRLALQVYLTSLAIRLVASAATRSTVDWSGFFSDYWFWNAYLVVAFLSPVLNAALRVLRRKWSVPGVRTFLAALALAFAVVPLPCGLGFVERGYTGLWFVVPYLIGAEIALEGEEGRLTFSRLWSAEALAWILPLVGWAGSSAMRRVPDLAHLSLNGSYASPIILAVATCHLLFFANLRIAPLPRLLRLAAATAFGVYLIHAHPLAQPFFRRLLDAFTLRTSTPALLATTLLFALLLYIACSLLDGVRLFLFARMNRLRQRTGVARSFRFC
ncbi:MAG: acyltransferase [Kiritimatiellae bacterium]|nr:acyltransferase [Kiritimatiellia bacterium]